MFTTRHSQTSRFFRFYLALSLIEIFHQMLLWQLQISRLIYTHSGNAILALSSNAIHLLWKWPQNYLNSSGKVKGRLFIVHMPSGVFILPENWIWKLITSLWWDIECRQQPKFPLYCGNQRAAYNSWAMTLQAPTQKRLCPVLLCPRMVHISCQHREGWFPCSTR